MLLDIIISPLITKKSIFYVCDITHCFLFQSTYHRIIGWNITKEKRLKRQIAYFTIFSNRIFTPIQRFQICNIILSIWSIQLPINRVWIFLKGRYIKLFGILTNYISFHSDFPFHRNRHCWLYGRKFFIFPFDRKKHFDTLVSGCQHGYRSLFIEGWSFHCHMDFLPGSRIIKGKYHIFKPVSHFIIFTDTWSQISKKRWDIISSPGCEPTLRQCFYMQIPHWNFLVISLFHNLGIIILLTGCQADCQTHPSQYPGK